MYKLQATADSQRESTVAREARRRKGSTANFSQTLSVYPCRQQIQMWQSHSLSLPTAKPTLINTRPWHLLQAPRAGNCISRFTVVREARDWARLVMPSTSGTTATSASPPTPGTRSSATSPTATARVAARGSTTE